MIASGNVYDTRNPEPVRFYHDECWGGFDPDGFAVNGGSWWPDKMAGHFTCHKCSREENPPRYFGAQRIG